MIMFIIPVFNRSVIAGNSAVNLCFFITNDDESREAINVERLVRRDKEKIGGADTYTFTCEIIKDNMKMLCDLRLNLSTNEWILYRM